jgi:DNA-binding CsgD family transcriptional regulator
MLFTDIVSSTTVVEELGDRRWKALLAQHHQEIRDCLRRAHGVEIDTAGDGFFAVFDDPGAAIRCAAEAIGRVQALGLEIRTAVHVGALESDGEKPVGVSVHVAARILPLAAPSAILVSSTAAALLPGSDVEVVDAGTHRLKGVTEPMQVRRVVAIDGGSVQGPLDAARAADLRSASASPPPAPSVAVGAPRPAVAPEPAELLIGREAELEAVISFVDAALLAPAALLLEGEAGIGKTTLWRSALALAEERGFTTLSCRPSESEARLSYAAIADLFDDVVDDELSDLPEVQRRALAVALLREEADAPVDPRSVAAAVLGLVRRLASTSPLLLAVDDEQWLDPASAEALGFAVRRLAGERVGVISASRVREGVPDPMALLRALGQDRLERVRVTALGRDELGELLRERIALDLPLPTLSRVQEVSRGNPFFALELGRALKGSGSELGTGGQLPVPEDLRDLLHVRLGGLPPSTREVLLLAAALSRPTVPLVVAAATYPGSVADELALAAGAGIVQVWGDEIGFVHPLFSSAVHEEASSAERRAAHLRLAGIARDPEERARHLALSADGPDADIAAALEEAAAHAIERGAPAAAAELCQLAADLTLAAASADLVRRKMGAADHLYMAGDLHAAVRILVGLLEGCPPGPMRADVLLHLGRIHWQDDLPQAARLLTEALDQQGTESRTQFEVHLELGNILMNAGDLDGAEPHVRAALDFANKLNDPLLIARALVQSSNLDGYRGGGNEHKLLDMAERVLGGTIIDIEDNRAVHATVLDRLDEGRDRFARLLEEATERGDEQTVIFIHGWLSDLELRAGNWDLAVHQDAMASSEAGGIGWSRWVEYLVRANRGDGRGIRRAALDSLDGCERLGNVVDRLAIRLAVGSVEIQIGDLSEAWRHLGGAWDLLMETGVGEPGLALFVPVGAETLIRLGRLEEAEPLVAWLEERGRTLDRPRALATGARCRGLLLAAAGNLAGALAALDDAVRHHERLPDPFELARTLLIQGSIRRRAKQKRPAREALEAALEIFERLGAAPWAERIRAELSAIGGRPAPTGELTPTEERVARLAAAGRTNREIAETLFLSVRTIEGHLSHAYHKLGVRSRTELAVVFEDRVPQA